MAKGSSLHVGLNKVSSAFPNASTLVGCENDARAMHDLDPLQHFSKEILLGSDATYGRVVTKIKNAAGDLEKGDIFVFTFAGHGSGEADEDRDERDHQDETLVLFDFLLFDDVLKRDLWPCFKRGVRILMVADSCHSGTVSALTAEALPSVGKTPQPTCRDHELSIKEIPVTTADGVQAREISETTRQRHLVEYRRFYEQVSLPIVARPIEASVLLLAACKDDEKTADGKPHGAFTQALLDVLQGPSPPTDYNDLFQKVSMKLAPRTPVVTVIPQPDPTFLAQRPFSI